MKLKTVLIQTIVLITIPKLFGDIVLYDEPQVTGYVRIAQVKGSVVANSRIETCSYSFPYSGIACIEGWNTSNTAGQGNKFSIVFPNGWISPSEFTALTYYIRQKSVAAGRMNIYVWGGVQSGTQVGEDARVGFNTTTENYGLNNSNITTYQLITIPISAFEFPDGSIVNRFTWTPINTSAGWYIDRIVLVGDGVIHYPDPYPPAEATPTP